MTFVFRFSLFSAFLLMAAYSFGRLFFPPESLPAGASEADRITIVLDAGHGGRDGGAVASDGTQEKHLNLAVAQKLAALLEGADIQVIMTRNEDTELASPDSAHKKRDDLTARLAMTQNLEHAIFVSIHMNQFPVEKYSGLQVYYSKNHAQSEVLARLLQENAVTLRAQNAREVKAAGDSIYLLSHVQIPAVLVECGFLSNVEERELLKSEDYQTKLAMNLYASIMTYLSENPI